VRDRRGYRCSCQTGAVQVWTGIGRVLARTRTGLDLSLVLSGCFGMLNSLSAPYTPCAQLLKIHGSAVNQRISFFCLQG